MKAIILTAGLGRRMLPLTERTHKSLLPMGDTTILGRIVDGLLGIDVRDILVVTGHLSDQVRAFLFERYPKVPFHFVHNERYRETNNIVSLAIALEQSALDSDVVVIECDVLFDPALLRRLTTNERGNIALVDYYRPGMDGTVVSVDHGIITQVYPPHLQGEDFDYRDKFKTVNIYRFDRDFCRARLQPLLSCYAQAIDSGCYYELVLGILINMQRETVRAEIVDGSQWAEVDDPNDLASARFVFEPQARAGILDCSSGGHWNFDILDFAFMRNMYFPTDAMMAEMRRALPTLVRSYGTAQRVLNEKLAYALRCRAERVLCLHGATQVFPLLPELLSAKRVLLPGPTFGEFPRWFPVHQVYRDCPGIDRDALDARAGDFHLVVVVNPNNPTGTTLSTEWLHALIAGHPRTTFLVDESFIDFAGQESLLHRLERQPLDNALVVASLSKSLGVPGLRLGYAYACNTRMVESLQARIPIWNLSSPAEFFLELLLKFQPELAASFARTTCDRTAFEASLAHTPGIAAVWPSGGNFLLLRLAGDQPARAQRAVEHLLAHDSIYVKNATAKFHSAAPYLRVAVRRPAENLRLLEALPEALRVTEAACL